MEHKSELGIILKTFPYQERDRVCVVLTESSGKITALAKGAIHSRRFGGALDTLTCSRLRFIQKPNTEMGRIDEAVVHHEFTRLRTDYDRLALASFAAEFCLRLVEPHAPARDLFVLLSNFLFHLDSDADGFYCTNVFLVKALHVMGYAPNLTSCSRCAVSAHSCAEGDFYWDSDAGGIICASCAPHASKKQLYLGLDAHVLFSECLAKPFKVLVEAKSLSQQTQQNLFAVLTDFLHHQVPGLPAGGFKSLRLVGAQVLGYPTNSL